MLGSRKTIETTGKFATHPTGALIMGGDYRGLALARSLGRHGVPVWVINQSEHRLAGMSRYAQRALYYPRWKDEGGIRFLLKTAHDNNLDKWMLFPTADESVRLISSHHKQLMERFQMTVPPWATLQWAVDKRLMHQLADRLGICHPRTAYPDSQDALSSIGFEFPMILKPTTRDQFNKLTAAKAWKIDNPRDLHVRYNEACHLLPAEMLMIQELIPGNGESQFSFAAVCRRGETLASLVARRTRQFPMDFGRASTFVETVEDIEAVSRPAKRFLEAIQYTGLVEIEFKRDERDGQFKLLDINPRVWGWYSLCEAAGVNFALILSMLCKNESVPKVSARVGVRWMRMTTDVLTAMKEIAAKRLSFAEYFRSVLSRKEAAIFSWDDPLPGLMELPCLVYTLGRRIALRDAI